MAVWPSGRGASFVVNHPLERPGFHLWARGLEHRWLVETLQLPVPDRGSEQSVSVLSCIITSIPFLKEQELPEHHNVRGSFSVDS